MYGDICMAIYGWRYVYAIAFNGLALRLESSMYDDTYKTTLRGIRRIGGWGEITLEITLEITFEITLEITFGPR